MIDFTFLFILILTFIITALTALLLVKIQQNAQLIKESAELKKSLDSMDEQAKIIVRTDMELSRIQEELDKKIYGLYALQGISHSISTTMEENQIFRKIEPEYLNKLGFEKALFFMWETANNEFVLKNALGYRDDELNTTCSYVNGNKDAFLKLIAESKTFSSIKSAGKALDSKSLYGIFKSDSFIFSPILSKQDTRGFIFVGSLGTDSIITAGDEELIEILSNELGQAIENASLFEKTWRAQQELEKKVAQRTQELTAALEEVKKMSKRKTDFVSSVSHELRTPLTSIKGYAAILLTGKLGEIPKEAKERLDRINRHSDELSHIVNELLDIARIESGRIPMNLESKSLLASVRKVEELLSVQLKERKIEFNINIDSANDTVLMDSGQIERVFINLIGNAMKFTPAQGSITIRSQKHDEKMVRIDVIDTGCGIPPEAQEAIFEEFYRVDNTINEGVKGTGLGLSLVKRIIEAHNGKIWVKSVMGTGSTFSFTLQKG